MSNFFCDLTISNLVQLCVIDWGHKMEDSVKPSLSFLINVESISIWNDDILSDVEFFLKNSDNWKGGIASMVKKELKQRAEERKIEVRNKIRNRIVEDEQKKYGQVF
jgi:hypothetical protein